MAEVPGLVNDHEFQLTANETTYLPTDFYVLLAGDSTTRKTNNYNYKKCYDGEFTKQYDDFKYLENDIVSVVHRLKYNYI
jgi:hypothetical protein